MAFNLSEMCEFHRRILDSVARYHEIVRICTASGHACSNCYHIEVAKMAIGEVVLFYAGAVERYEEAAEPDRMVERTDLSHRRPGFVYLMENKRNGFIKIGFSTNPQYREQTLQSEEPDVEMLFFAPGTVERERLVQFSYGDRKVRGEWFDLTPAQIEEIKFALRQGGDR